MLCNNHPTIPANYDQKEESSDDDVPMNVTLPPKIPDTTIARSLSDHGAISSQSSYTVKGYRVIEELAHSNPSQVYKQIQDIQMHTIAYMRANMDALDIKAAHLIDKYLVNLNTDNQHQSNDNNAHELGQETDVEMNDRSEEAIDPHNHDLIPPIIHCDEEEKESTLTLNPTPTDLYNARLRREDQLDDEEWVAALKDQNEIPCMKCKNKYKCVWNEAQRKHITYECTNCRANGEEYRFWCPCCIKNKSYKGLKTHRGFIKHLMTFALKGRGDHALNLEIFKVFGVKPCAMAGKNGCEKVIKLSPDTITFSGLSNEYNGVCWSCDKLRIMNEITGDPNDLGMFKDILSCIALKASVADMIPESIVNELSDVYATLMRRACSNDPQEKHINLCLLQLLIKIVLHKPNRGMPQQRIDALRRKKLNSFRSIK
eukprot:453303_1